MKLITLPFAGGNKYSLSFLKRKIFDLEVVNLEYPGRGARNSESFLKDIDAIVNDIFIKIINEIGAEPYIIYGHSMGALVGYLVCQKIEESGIRQPLKLIVSGKKSPSIKNERILSHLPDQLFWEEVIKIGGIPSELHSHHELINFYIPILRADFEVFESYNYVKKKKLNLPIDVFYGTDEEISENEIKEWENESTEEVVVKPLKGNHFFIYNQEGFFVNYFNSLAKNLVYN